MRRRRAEKRVLPPDPKYGRGDVTAFVHKVMERGKGTLAHRLVYQAFDIVAKETKRSPLEVFEEAMKNVTPALEVKPRRVGGATYQVPVEVRAERGLALARSWLLNAARARKGRPMAERLAAELMEAAKSQGAAAKRKDDLQKMAEANRAFVHYRW